ncbi:hypothetical protein [Streptomyces sp. NPDC007205]
MTRTTWMTAPCNTTAVAANGAPFTAWTTRAWQGWTAVTGG